MSQSLWDILGERIGDINPSLLYALVNTFNNPEDRIEALLRYADDGYSFASIAPFNEGTARPQVMPSCRKNLKSRKHIHGRKSKTFKEEIESILCKYNFAYFCDGFLFTVILVVVNESIDQGTNISATDK